MTPDRALLRVRPAALTDVDALARVHNDGWRDTYGEWLAPRFYDAAALARREDLWRNLTVRPPAGAILRVAERNDVVVGFAAAGRSRDVSAPAPRQLFSLYVTRTAQGNGVGSALLTAVLGDAAAHCWVAAQNHQAIGFYRRHGFEPTGATHADPDLDQLPEISLTRGVQPSRPSPGRRQFT